MKYRKHEAKDYAKTVLKGVWTALPTHFTPDDRIDEAGNASNLEHCISRLKLEGHHYCIGNVGEFWALTNEERMRVVEVNVEVAKGRIPLIAGCHHQNPYEAVKLAQRLAALPNICGFKQGVGKPQPTTALRDAIGKDVEVSVADEAPFLYNISVCGDRWLLNYCPHLYQVPGYTPVNDYARAALAGGPVRVPCAEMTREAKEQMRADLEATGLPARARAAGLQRRAA